MPDPHAVLETEDPPVCKDKSGTGRLLLADLPEGSKVVACGESGLRV
jgi:hypothetical protein